MRERQKGGFESLLRNLDKNWVWCEFRRFGIRNLGVLSGVLRSCSGSEIIAMDSEGTTGEN